MNVGALWEHVNSKLQVGPSFANELFTSFGTALNGSLTYLDQQPREVIVT